MSGKKAVEMILAWESNDRFVIGTNHETEYYRCILTTNGDEASRKWSFVAYTYDPVTKSFSCAFNDQIQKALPPGAYSPRPLNNKFDIFTADMPFLMDDLFYFERYTNNDDLKALYETSTYIKLRIQRYYNPFECNIINTV